MKRDAQDGGRGEDNMTIREVLEADWTVSWFEVEVRNKETTRLFSQYLIGKDVKPSKYMRFACETAAGDIYKNHTARIVIVDKIIQFRQLPKRPQGKEMCVGVLTELIPKEILDLTISHMRPSDCGRSDGMHGYRFHSYVDYWGGIPGEDEQMELMLE